jgi:lipoprotein-anchoring transpeptidase ErfK/SrfK
MTNLVNNFSRREFLRLSRLGAGSIALGSIIFPKENIQYSPNQRLGRVTTDFGEGINLRARPSTEAAEVGTIYGDDVVPWLREVVGYTPYRNQRWVETPNGYVWSPLLQPVKHISNQPLSEFPIYANGPGSWVEVTVPFVDVSIASNLPIGPRVSFLYEESLPIRLYYGQIMWADEIREGINGVEYHVRERHGSYGDHFWGAAEAFRPIEEAEVAPISPEIENKSILVDLNRQTLSCFEEGREVFFCRVSSGRLGAATPVGKNFRIFWKLVSVHMAGGTAGAGYDLTGVAWPTFLVTGGIAIHGTFWHNNYGEKTSAGCINVLPEHAKFISRWSSPAVPYDPGNIDVAGTNTGTNIRVVEA